MEKIMKKRSEKPTFRKTIQPSNRRPIFQWAVALTVAGCLWPLSDARATLLTYEGFDFSGIQDGDPVNGESGTTSVGWKTGVSWTTRTGSATWDESGLTFGSMPVSGGAARIDDTDSNAATIDRQIDGSLSALSTVYGSFLFAPGTVDSNGSTGFFTDPDASRDNLSQVDSAASSLQFGTENGAPLLNPGQTGSPAVANNTGTATSVGTTYMATGLPGEKQRGHGIRRAAGERQLYRRHGDSRAKCRGTARRALG